MLDFSEKRRTEYNNLKLFMVQKYRKTVGRILYPPDDCAKILHKIGIKCRGRVTRPAP